MGRALFMRPDGIGAQGGTMEQLIAQVVGGALGGVGGGKAVSDADMGFFVNLFVGAVAGTLGGPYLGALVDTTDIAAVAASLLGSGVAGLVAQLCIGLLTRQLRA